MDLRFSSTLQIMLSLSLAHEQKAPVTSTHLAKGLGVPPSFVRKLVAPLTKQGLVTATLGKGGGLKLSKAAKDIGLDVIYDAIYQESPIWETRTEISHHCVVTRNIDIFLVRLNDQSRAAIKKTLSAWTLENSLDCLKDFELPRR